MTLNLNIPKEIEVGLTIQAHAEGLSVEDYAMRVLRNAVTRQRTKKALCSLPNKRPARKKSLAQLFADSPFKGLDLEFERSPDFGRPVKL